MKELLEELGMKKALSVVDKAIEDLPRIKRLEEIEKEKKARFDEAKKRYQCVTQDMVNDFNAVLKKKTYQRTDGNSYYEERWQKVRFTALQDYAGVPPVEALQKVKEAKDAKIFDDFVVADLAWESNRTEKPIPDPIIFGRIDGYSELFSIAVWDNDLKVEDFIRNIGDL